MLGAIYVGCTPFLTSGRPSFTQEHAACVLNGTETWRPWVERWNGRQAPDMRLANGTFAICLKCATPMPPYADFQSNVQGFQMLVIGARAYGELIPGNPENPTVLAFDNRGCHLGVLPLFNTKEALTWLPLPMVSTVPMGHQGL